MALANLEHVSGREISARDFLAWFPGRAFAVRPCALPINHSHEPYRIAPTISTQVFLTTPSARQIILPEIERSLS